MLRSCFLREYIRNSALKPTPTFAHCKCGQWKTSHLRWVGKARYTVTTKSVSLQIEVNFCSMCLASASTHFWVKVTNKTLCQLPNSTNNLQYLQPTPTNSHKGPLLYLPLCTQSCTGMQIHSCAWEAPPPAPSNKATKALDAAIPPGFALDCTTSASAMVLPSKQKRGIFYPTTPDTTGPVCSPTRMVKLSLAAPN